MTSTFKAIIATTFFAAATLTSAHAAVVKLTFAGTVTSGSDLLNEFNTGSSDLTGQTYIQTLSFDTDDLNELYRTPLAYAAGFDNKLLQAWGTATINGKTSSWNSTFAQGHLAFSSQVSVGGGDEFQMGVDVFTSPSEWRQVGMKLNSSQVSFVGTANPEVSHFYNGDLSAFSSYAFYINAQAANSTFFFGDLSRVSYVVGEVPEPATAALFLLGLGMAGARLRKKA